MYQTMNECLKLRHLRGDNIRLYSVNLPIKYFTSNTENPIILKRSAFEGLSTCVLMVERLAGIRDCP